MNYVEKYMEISGEIADLKNEFEGQRNKVFENKNKRVEELESEISKLDNQIDKVEEDCARAVYLVRKSYDDKIIWKTKEMQEIEHVIEVLADRCTWDVQDFDEGDIMLNNREKKIVFFDELYSGDAIVLRAMVVHDNSAIDNEWANSLYILGVGESHGIRRKADVVKLNVKKRTGMLNCNVRYTVMVSDDLEQLVDYYKEHVKALEEDNRTVEDLKEVIEENEKAHVFNEEIKAKYTLEDFNDILGMKCINCGKDALTISSYKLVGDTEHKCRKCGSKLVTYKGAKL